jgi:drug/metabolite transporter (DMT)-like permease
VLDQEQHSTSAKDEEKKVASFDPFELSSGEEQRIHNDNGAPVIEREEEEDGQIGIWAARGLLLLVAAVWGTNFASVKYLETLCFHPPCHHPPSEAAFARFGVAAIVSLPLLFKQRLDVVLAGLECGLWISLGYFSQAMALVTIDSGTCAFICSLTVVFVPLVSYFVYGKEIKPLNLVAALVALCGVGVLEGMIDIGEILGTQPALAETASAATATASAVASSSSSIETAASAVPSFAPLANLAKTLGVEEGDILALGQPIGFGYTFARIEHYQEKFKDVPNRVLTIAAAQCVAVGLVSLLWVLHDFNYSLPNFGYMWEPHRIAAIAWTGIVTTVFAIFLEGIALQTATATDAALTFSTEPIWAGFFGVLLLHETMGPEDYVGGAIILAACLIACASDFDFVGNEEKKGDLVD